jgi:hypothetical protein
MEEVFKTRVEAPQTPEIAPPAPLSLKSDELAGDEVKMQDEQIMDEKTLEIWEGLHRRKYATEYFDLGNIDGEFNLKMDTSIIDKFVKGELDSKEYEKNTENWKKILQDIETEIGSERMELFSRIKRIVGYIRVVNKYRQAKLLKEKFLNSTDFE